MEVMGWDCGVGDGDGFCCHRHRGNSNSPAYTLAANLIKDAVTRSIVNTVPSKSIRAKETVRDKIVALAPIVATKKG